MHPHSTIIIRIASESHPLMQTEQHAGNPWTPSWLACLSPLSKYYWNDAKTITSLSLIYFQFPAQQRFCTSQQQRLLAWYRVLYLPELLSVRTVHTKLLSTLHCHNLVWTWWIDIIYVVVTQAGSLSLALKDKHRRIYCILNGLWPLLLWYWHSSFSCCFTHICLGTVGINFARNK